MVKTFPASKKEKFEKVGEHMFEAYVKEPAQHNLANTRVRELVAKEYTVPVGKVYLQTGHRALKKTLLIEN